MNSQPQTKKIRPNARLERTSLTMSTSLAMSILAASSIFYTPLSSADINWDDVKGKTITLFSPGQSSWEWILTNSTHSAAKSVKKGTDCLECHEGEQEKIGKLIGSGKKIEPSPINNNPGSLPVTIKFAQQGGKLFVHLVWKETGLRTGMNKKYQASAAMMFSDGTVKASKIAGCWSTCHVDMEKMPKAGSTKLSKYLFASRSKISRSGGGEHYKSSEKLTKLIDKGFFMEWWRAQLNPGQPALTTSGYILDKKNETVSSPLTSSATFSNGKWSVTFSRKLQIANNTNLAISNDNEYPFGIAIHDGQTDKRFHFVSFGYNFSLNSSNTDFIARQH